MSEFSDIHNVGYETGYREGYEAVKKEILDAFFPEDVKKELIQFLKENLSEKKND